MRVISSSAQQISCILSRIAIGEDFAVSFIYGFNTAVERRSLWVDLLAVKNYLSTQAWCLVGDFNVCLGPDEASNSANWNPGMLEFSDFISQATITDLRCSGAFYTWWDSSIRSPMFKKLDRCLVNCQWLSMSQAKILPVVSQITLLLLYACGLFRRESINLFTFLII